MKKGQLRNLKELAYFSSLGLAISLSIFIGLGVGVWLDSRWGTNPWMTLLFLLLGIVAGYRNIGLAIKKSRKM
jgi:ATP synthase protein I